MKVLCLGRKGDGRSAVLSYLLKQRGHDAIAVGMRCMGRDTRKMMLDWADMIILLHNKCGEGVPKEYWSKMKIWEVGPSREPTNLDQELVKLFEDHIKWDNL